MKHFMKLYSTPFNQIRDGNKKYELRLNDLKRQKLHIGDEIEFSNIDNPDQHILCRIIELNKYPSFDVLYKSLPLLECGYTNETVSEARAEDMLTYYSEEQQKTWGVLGIKISVISSN
jgi:ASC-1-like (ASCH) protein